MSWERETEEKPDPEIEPEWFQQAQWPSEMNRPVSMLVNEACLKVDVSIEKSPGCLRYIDVYRRLYCPVM